MNTEKKPPPANRERSLSKPRGAAKIRRAERIERALELKKVGLSYQQVGDQLDCSVAEAHRLVSAGLKEMAERRDGKAEELREMLNERLESLVFRFWQKAAGGDKDAAQMILNITARQAKMYGVDAPTKIAPTNPDGTSEYEPEDRTRWVYFLPTPAGTEAEWLAQQQQSPALPNSHPTSA